MEKLPVEVLHIIISKFEYCIPYDARFDRTASKFKVTTAHAGPVEWKSDLGSLRNLRLTCRTLSHPATRALFNVATVAWYPGDLEKYPYLRQSLANPVKTLQVASGSPVASMIKSLKIEFSTFYEAPSWFETRHRQTSCFEIAEDDHEKRGNARVLVEQLKQVLECLPRLESLTLLSGSWEGRNESDELSFTPVLDLSLIDAFNDAISKSLRIPSLIHLATLHLQLPLCDNFSNLSKALQRHGQLYGQLVEVCLSVGDGTAQDGIEAMWWGDEDEVLQRYTPFKSAGEARLSVHLGPIGFCLSLSEIGNTWNYWLTLAVLRYNSFMGFRV